MIPASVGIAVLKYRLYDIDVVIKKTVVFTVVASVLTALYLGVIALATVGTVSRVVVGIVLLLVTFNPVRRAARSLADRVVYGRRATSYEVLADFSEHMAETYATDDVLPRMAQILAGATGATRATVWLMVGGELRPAAASGGDPPPAIAAPGGTLAEISDDVVAEVRHHGELLGALSVTTPPNDPFDPARRKLVNDLASQAGLVLRNVRLIEELKASRQRLVAAQDEERRKLERNLHDGAQQQLVALSVKVRLAQQLTTRDAERASAMLEDVQTDATDALENLRQLARGIYPPLLADKGLVAALESQARRAPMPVRIRGEDVGRYGQDIEAAVYFSCLEALQNVAKYAEATAGRSRPVERRRRAPVRDQRRRDRLRSVEHRLWKRSSRDRRPSGRARRLDRDPQRHRGRDHRDRSYPVHAVKLTVRFEANMRGYPDILIHQRRTASPSSVRNSAPNCQPRPSVSPRRRARRSAEGDRELPDPR